MCGPTADVAIENLVSIAVVHLARDRPTWLMLLHWTKFQYLERALIITSATVSGAGTMPLKPDAQAKPVVTANSFAGASGFNVGTCPSYDQGPCVVGQECPSY